MEEKIRKIARKYALKNAVNHGGKAQLGAIFKGVLWEMPELKKNKESFSLLKKVANEVLEEINNLSLEEQEKILALEYPEVLKEEEEKRQKDKEIKLPELEGAEQGKVVVRFAPFPSGPLHIGNARQVIINNYYAEKYGGKFLLVIDDTIGSDEKPIEPEAYDMIVEDVKWLGVELDEKNIIYKSDRLELYYKYAEELIKLGKAYVCTCDPAKLREYRKKGIECEHRNQSVEENLEEWKKMFTTYKQGEAVLRIKTSMQHKNPAFRDRVLLRISEKEHPRVGTKYRVWPLLEFSWAVDDYLLGITHVIRGKDLMMETMMEQYIWDIFGWKGPKIIHTGLVRLEGVKISKSKSREEVKKGLYIGWDDPRTWSIRSLAKRGFLKESLYDFFLSMGLSRSDIVAPITNLYAFNRKRIDPISRRYVFISNPKKLKIPEIEEKEIKFEFHPDNKDLGHKTFYFKGEVLVDTSTFDSIKEGEIFRLAELGNFKKEGENLIFVSQSYEDFRSLGGKKILLWLPNDNDQLMKARIVMPDYTIVEGVIEKNIIVERQSDLKIVQLENFGFGKVQDIKEDKVEIWFAHP